MNINEMLSLKWNNYQATFNKSLEYLRYQEDFTDLTIFCEGKQYAVHRLILATCSDYFQEILKNMLQNTNVAIVLTEVIPEDFEILLDYMYIGKATIKQERIESVLNTAKFLRIKGLMVSDTMDCSNSLSEIDNSKRKLENPFSKAKRQKTLSEDSSADQIHSQIFHSVDMYDKILPIKTEVTSTENPNFLTSIGKEILVQSSDRGSNVNDAEVIKENLCDILEIKFFEEDTTNMDLPLLRTSQKLKTSHNNEQLVTAVGAMSGFNGSDLIAPLTVEISKQRIDDNLFEESDFESGKSMRHSSYQDSFMKNSFEDHPNQLQSRDLRNDSPKKIRLLSPSMEDPLKPQREGSNRRCSFCPRSKDRKTRKACQKCYKPICPDHSTMFCINCSLDGN